VNPAKSLIVKALERVGYELRAVDWPSPSFRRGLQNLSRVICPTTVIDCGVADGTAALYAAFPSCKYLLVEANPEYEQSVAGWARRLGGSYELVFCGAAPGVQTVHVYEDGRKTSRFTITRPLARDEDIQVRVETLDHLVEKHGLKGPFLLKLDIEGAELDALAGAPALLTDTQAIVAEVALVEKFVGGPQLADVLEFLRDRHFVAFDIFGGVPRRAPAGLSQVDVVFVPDNSPLFRHL
jgi:FkbM family methyltransferase